MISLRDAEKILGIKSCVYGEKLEKCLVIKTEELKRLNLPEEELEAKLEILNMAYDIYKKYLVKIDRKSERPEINPKTVEGVTLENMGSYFTDPTNRQINGLSDINMTEINDIPRKNRVTVDHEIPDFLEDLDLSKGDDLLKFNEIFNSNTDSNINFDNSIMDIDNNRSVDSNYMRLDLNINEDMDIDITFNPIEQKRIENDYSKPIEYTTERTKFEELKDSMEQIMQKKMSERDEVNLVSDLLEERSIAPEIVEKNVQHL